MAAGAYRLDELGWLQFERLCTLALECESGLTGLEWRGRADAGRVALVDAPLALASAKLRLDGPVAVAVVWVRDAPTAAERRPFLLDGVSQVPVELGSWFDRVVVMTNLDAGPASSALRSLFQGKRELIVLGAAELGAIVDRHPPLRAAMPSLLGLRDLAPLMRLEALRRSSLDTARCQELARVFWPTRAYRRAREVLDTHRFVVLTGPPEMGKTAIAQMLALVQLTVGWEAHDCREPDDVWRAWHPDREQVFIADDAFGSTEFQPDAAERWARELGRLLPRLDAKHWLVWTSRPAPLRAGLRAVHRERGSERFPSPGQVLVDASHLDLDEKTLILFRHAKAAGTGGAARKLVRYAGLRIVEHPHFTPERIRRLVDDGLAELLGAASASSRGDEQYLLDMLESRLATPTKAMRTSFRALGVEHRELLVSLLDAPAGLIDERELTATVRRHHPGGLSRPPRELIDRLTDHFLRVTTLGIGWVHPSWRDLVLDELREDPIARRRFLAAAGVEGVMLALSQAGGVAGERVLPLLVDDADWDQLGDRMSELLRELDDHDLARVLLAARTVSSLTDVGQLLEAQSFVAYVLDAARRRWDEQRRPLPVMLLDAWYVLREALAHRPEPPQLAITWAELHPATAVIVRPEKASLARTEEWLSLAETLDHHDRVALASLGFFDRDHDLLEALIVVLMRAASNDKLQGLALGILERIERLVPKLASKAHSATEIARLAEKVERRRWWEPEDITVPPSTEPRGERWHWFGREDVGRVLSDL